MSALLTFDDFEPGAPMGSVTDVIDAALLEKWHALYASDADLTNGVPTGLATVLMMRAYMRILVPRPPGNIHAGQKLMLHAAIERGETVRTALQCAGKKMHRERRFVEFMVKATGHAERLLFTGTINLIWAQ